MAQTDGRPATAEQLAIVAHEERLLEAAREALAEAARRRVDHAADRGALFSLRDEYASAGEEDLPAMLDQMHQAHARAQRARAELLPDPMAPYFAHMRVRTAGRSRDVLLGSRSFVDTARGVSIVEWRKAPIAEVLFACEPGEDYEIEIDGRTLEGVLERVHFINFEKGALSSISVEGGALRRDGEGFRFEPGELTPSLSGTTGRGASPLTLDEQQRALIERDPREPLVVLGSAGCGKTTVALHRADALCREHPDTFPPARVLVLVPEPGLRQLSRRILDELGAEGIAVRTFEEWIRVEARRVFPKLPAREPPDPPFAASRIKRHPALLSSIERLVGELGREIADRLDRLLAGRGTIREAIEARTEPVLDERLRRAEEMLLETWPPACKKLLQDGFREERQRLSRVRADHRRLVGDRELLTHAVQVAGGDLHLGLVEQVLSHTNRQLDAPSEVAFAHVVDLARLATLDGRSLDDGTPEATAGTVDVEDYAILFELLWQKTGTSSTRAGALSRYAHIVLDEAQELAPIELGVIGRAVDAGGSVTVAGDAAQRIDRTGHFGSWESVMQALGVRAAPALLSTSYRSPRPIVELAHAILGPDAPEEMPHAVKEGPPVLRTVVPDEGQAAAILCRSLRRLRDRDPGASIAVITRDAATARALANVLSRGLPVRLVEEGDFCFGPGVEVTEVAEVKGLEFDHVIVPDASAKAYPDTPEERRTLHVAVTRASHGLWLLSPGAPSPILPPVV